MILEILGSASFGSLLGGVFGLFSKSQERKLLESKNSHELNMVKARTDAAIETAKLNMQEAELAGSLAVEKLDAQAFVESQKSNNKVSEIIKSLIRPIILGLLMFQTYLILDSLQGITGGLTNLPAESVMDLYRTIVYSIVGLTSTAVGWYFSTRSSKQFDYILNHINRNPK